MQAGWVRALRYPCMHDVGRAGNRGASDVGTTQMRSAYPDRKADSWLQL
jgi:hypothetical protein